MSKPASPAGGLSRRAFAARAACGLSVLASPAGGALGVPGLVPPESADRWALTIGSAPISIGGQAMDAPCVDGCVPGPTLRWREGDMVEIAVTNHLSEATSIHWHGLRVPADMDGVPGLSFAGIAPGQTFTYRFPVRQSGTYWYHSHSHMQEARGLYGALVIDPAAPDPVVCARDYVIVLSDWTDVPPVDIVANLKMQDDYYVFRQRSAASLPGQAERDGGLVPALRSRLAWARMNMSATDIADVTGAIYAYALNGRAPDADWRGLFRPGERVRLRIINAASMTFFDVRIPGLVMTVVAADGQDIVPVPVDEFRIGVAETYDVVVQPLEDRAYAIFAQSEDRTGYARGTLATRGDQQVAVPPMDPRPVRTMIDMGMGAMAGGRMGGMTMPDAGGGDHAMTGARRNVPGGMSPDMSRQMPGPMDMRTMPGMAVPVSGQGAPLVVDDPGPPPIGVENQNVAMMPVDRLSSPGDGLAHNGRHVLTYAMLRATRPGMDPRPPSREIILHLTGNMERYIWGFNGRKYSESGPIRLARNERVRFTLINDTMMEHPIHLHGLWSELENRQGDFRPYKHTIISQPGSKLSYLVTADTPGMWAYHCHLLYHMDLGMFRTVMVG